jgi:hypothetical protein
MILSMPPCSDSRTRVARILDGLRDEGHRTGAGQLGAASGKSVGWRLWPLLAARGNAGGGILAEQKVWEKRKPLLRQAVQRLTLTGLPADCCAPAPETDQVIKGAGNRVQPWDELLANGLAAGGSGSY